MRPWDAAALRAALVGPAGPWARLDVVDRVGSTNAELLAAAAQGAPDRTVLVAEHQDAGRGRLGRAWTTRGGGRRPVRERARTRCRRTGSAGSRC